MLNYRLPGQKTTFFGRFGFGPDPIDPRPSAFDLKKNVKQKKHVKDRKPHETLKNTIFDLFKNFGGWCLIFFGWIQQPPPPQGRCGWGGPQSGLYPSGGGSAKSQGYVWMQECKCTRGAVFNSKEK